MITLFMDARILPISPLMAGRPWNGGQYAGGKIRGIFTLIRAMLVNPDITT
jgi:hypothetical protein